MLEASSSQLKFQEPSLLSKCDYRTSPIHLRAAAYLYGYDTALLHDARVLELGCGLGLNARAFAVCHPNAQVIGIDLDESNISLATQRSDANHIANLQLFALSLDVLLEAKDIGEFDYIIIRGIFSLLDAPARSALLNFCKTHLSANGIICIGYPAYPGSKTQEIVRDALVFHSSLAGTDEQRLGSARAMLGFLAQAISTQNPLQAPLNALINEAEGSSDAILSLRYLQGFEHPTHFIEFNELILQSNLTYVGDADAYSELPQTWGKNAQDMYDIINPTHHKILGQQYLDFISNRAYRLSILAHSDHADHILSLPDTSRLRDLRWSGCFTRTLDDQDQPQHMFLDNNDEHIHTRDEDVQKVLEHLGFVWPGSLDYTELAASITSPTPETDTTERDDTTRIAEKSLESIFTQLGAKVHLSRETTPYDCSSEKTIRLIPDCSLASSENGTLSPAVNLWQQEVTCKWNDAELAFIINNLSTQHALPPKAWPTNSPTSSKNKIDGELSPVEILSLTNSLRSKGLLQGSEQAWQDYEKFAIQTLLESPARAAQHCCILMTLSTKSKTKKISKSPSPATAFNHQLSPKIQKIKDAQSTGQQELAEKLSEDLVSNFPNSWDAWQTYAQNCVIYDQHEKLVRAELHAIPLQPADMLAYAGLAIGLSYKNQGWLSQKLLERIVKIDPNCGPAWDRLGTQYQDNRSIKKATFCAKRAVELDPKNIDRLNNLARAYAAQTRIKESLETYEKAIKMMPSDIKLRHNYLFTAQHYLGIDPKQLFQAHKDFGALCKKLAARSKLTLKHTNEKSPERQLRIGFVSGDLRNHAVAYFIEPYFEHLNKSLFQLHAYHNHYIEDHVSERLKKNVTEWNSIYGKSDEWIAKKINEDKIDILIDLSGHTAHNRLPMFAYKPAPIQLSCVGYPGTTGLAEMDYVPISVSNSFGNLEDQFTEKLLLLPDRIPFNRDLSSIEANALPMLSNGYITFGSFNRTQKISDGVLKIWSKILEKVKNSRLILANMTDDSMVDHFKCSFKEYGIDVNRIDFRFRLPMNEYQKLHLEVDLLLDTFPYNGGTTTNHALWMGVPTLTFAGETLACRHGVPLLKQYGLDEFIAFSLEEYIHKACAFPEKQEWLAEIRSTLRQRMNASDASTTDAATTFGYMLRGIWRRWCDNTPPASLDFSEHSPFI